MMVTASLDLDSKQQHRINFRQKLIDLLGIKSTTDIDLIAERLRKTPNWVTQRLYGSDPLKADELADFFWALRVDFTVTKFDKPYHQIELERWFSVLNLNELPQNREVLKKARNQALQRFHRDHGGSDQVTIEIMTAYRELSKRIGKMY